MEMILFMIIIGKLNTSLSKAPSKGLQMKKMNFIVKFLLKNSKKLILIKMENLQNIF